jgi:hypothetical protein
MKTKSMIKNLNKPNKENKKQDQKPKQTKQRKQKPGVSESGPKEPFSHFHSVKGRQAPSFNVIRVQRIFKPHKTSQRNKTQPPIRCPELKKNFITRSN